MTSLPIGTIVASIFGAKSAPAGWLPCDGSEIPKIYDELISLLSSDRTPNLIGRTLVGAGPLEHASVVQTDGQEPDFLGFGTEQLTIGNTGGETRHRLTLGEMPRHWHKIEQGNFYLHHRSFDGKNDEERPYTTKGSQSTHIQGTNSEGGDQSHNNLQPYYAVMYYIIAK